jgi:hypothetical protein
MKKTIPRHRTKTYLEPATVLLLKQVGLGFLVLASVGLIITATWYFTRIPALTINTIEVEGGITIDREGVRQRIEDELEGTYLRLFPKRFAYFYPHQKILTTVEQVDRIKNVKLARVSGTVLKVTYDEYVPDTLWCRMSNHGECYFLDETGYAFAVAPSLLGESVVRYFDSEKELALKTSPFSEVDYKATKAFTERMAAIGWYVSQVEINSARDVFYTLAEGGELKATLTDDQAKPFENLETILKSEEFMHLKPGNFKYLDLRFGTRVFVNEEREEEVATSTATSTEEGLDVVVGE